MKNVPTLDEINDILQDEATTVRFLLESEIFCATERECRKCGRIMRLYIESLRWRCGRRGCESEISLRTGTLFAKSRLQCREIVRLGYLWLNRVPTTSIIGMSGCSANTVCDFNRHFRELVADSLELEDCVIGGEGVVVELDESKLGKRKYERGHRVEGVWVVGGIERTEAKRTFIVTVENRSAAALLGIIHRHVLPGSIVFTDMWKGYAGITEVLNLEHRTVNHSVEYVSEDGTHTNTIEATWCGLKLLVPKRNRTKDVEGFLWEYMWRKKNRGRLWAGIIEALKVVAYE